MGPNNVLQLTRPRVGKMLECGDLVLEWRLHTHGTVDQWVHPDAKFCLIGDCAHAMTPNLA